MIKRKTAIFFILFATLLLLAHAFVPHHHHTAHICLSAQHCPSDCSAHEHGFPVNDHAHDPQTDSEFCVLKQAVFISSHQNLFDKYGIGNDKPLSIPDFQVLVPTSEWKSKVPGQVLSGAESIIFLNYCCFAVPSSGLRAPPVV